MRSFWGRKKRNKPQYPGLSAALMAENYRIKEEIEWMEEYYAFCLKVNQKGFEGMKMKELAEFESKLYKRWEKYHGKVEHG